jgi:protein arginine kinase activator
MKCEACQSADATVHLTQIISGHMQKVDLCEKCAKEKGVADPAGFSLADMLLGLGGTTDDAKPSIVAELTCPSCGFTQNDFKKTGRLGCPQCYQTFADGLGNLLKDMHKGTQHQGKIPSRLARTQLYADKLRDLQRNLTDAVKEERYEQAAALRDEISQLELQLKA